MLKLIGPAPEGLSDAEGRRSGRPPGARVEALQRSLRRRASHHPPARHFYVRAGQRLPPGDLVVLPLPPVLQLGAGLPALPRGLRRDVMVTPDLPEPQLADLSAAIERSLEGYRRLTEILTPDFAARLRQRLPRARKGNSAGAESRGSPARSRNGRRKSRATSCRWRRRLTSITRSTG